MTDFHVEVVKLGRIGKHPNADNLQITQIRKGIPCIMRTGDYQEGDLAVYVPVDSIVPLDRPEFKFLDRPRIKARRLRGIFSMGLLIKPQPGMKEGDQVDSFYGIERWEDPVDLGTDGVSIHCPIRHQIPTYDLESVRRFPDILVSGETIVVTEKIHGANTRICWHEGILYVGSKNRWLAQADNSAWWNAVKKLGIDKIKYDKPIVFYGECYGKIQDLKYGLKNDTSLRFFDAYKYDTNEWLTCEYFWQECRDIGLPIVPEIYYGPYIGIEHLNELASGNTLMIDTPQIREGIVVTTYDPRWNQEIGRVKLKHVSEAYYLRK